MWTSITNLVALHARFLKLASVITVSTVRKSSPCACAYHYNQLLFMAHGIFIEHWMRE
jgi:hypothetical protein